MNDYAQKLDFAIALCEEAGAMALEFFEDRERLEVHTKGAQDWVTEADRNVEDFVRERLARRYPRDGIVGEERGHTPGTSGFDWVIDPIDGTTNFVNGIPLWSVVLAGVEGGRTTIGVICDPNAKETFAAALGSGAELNRTPLKSGQTPLESGTIGVGYSNRVDASTVPGLIAELIGTGAMFHRNASGAISLAYVAAGRLAGYVEEHMNAWDCLAGQLLVREAGGRVEDQDADAMIRDGGRVIVGNGAVFDLLKEIAETAWSR